LSQEKININLTIKEIDAILCGKCKKRLRKLVKEKLPDNLIDKLVFNP